MRVIDWSSNVCSSDLGTGISVLRAGWRRPNDLDLCTLDMLAAADLAARAGATRFVTGGHSFGGAIAVRAGMAMGDWTRGVLTFATQSAGCEEAGGLLAPLLAFHGTRDELLPLVASQARSEEHTSELQSLMRISYAV